MALKNNIIHLSKGANQGEDLAHIDWEKANIVVAVDCSPSSEAGLCQHACVV
jgi:hypothetical protein